MATQPPGYPALPKPSSGGTGFIVAGVVLLILGILHIVARVADTETPQRTPHGSRDILVGQGIRFKRGRDFGVRDP
jgi:hypothetical protein